MTTLFLEPLGGLAGDMLLAALLDLGDPRFTLAHLEALAAALVPGEARLALTRVERGSLAAAHLAVTTPESHHAPHRHLADLLALLEAAELPLGVKRTSAAVLTRLAEAEARVHGITVDEVHFHEVGAVDTLIDVCGAALALERLGVERVACAVPITGEGSVRCAHGVMPVPVPAVVELLRGRELRVAGGPGERLTPTGAALLAELCAEFGAPARFACTAVGYGGGTRDFAEGPPNLVRVQLGRAADGARRAEAWLLEAQLDDATGEELGYCLALLREAGALDAWSAPLAMKKERPGVLLSALCRADARARLEGLVFEHTPTLGVRWTRVERTECAREPLEVELDGERVRCQLRVRPDYPGRTPFGERDVFVEYEDLARVARASGEALRVVERRAVRAALAALQARES
ncbi:MAG: nickel pincer cofactor biosynthesis protein LarC [Planctomycetes bacterium]|nr:nickel pincer cofactor biosynthesis protein LarC [Planctomycetota bacterium]